MTTVIGTRDRAAEKLNKHLARSLALKCRETLRVLGYFSYSREQHDKFLNGIVSFQNAIKVKEKYLMNAESKFRMELKVMHVKYRQDSKLRNRCFKGWKRFLKKFSLVTRLRVKKRIDELEHKTTRIRYQIKRLEAKCKENYTDLYRSIGCHLSVFMRSQDSCEHNLYGQTIRGNTRWNFKFGDDWNNVCDLSKRGLYFWFGDACFA